MNLSSILFFSFCKQGAIFSKLFSIVAGGQISFKTFSHNPYANFLLIISEIVTFSITGKKTVVAFAE